MSDPDIPPERVVEKWRRGEVDISLRGSELKSGVEYLERTAFIRGRISGLKEASEFVFHCLFNRDETSKALTIKADSLEKP